MNQTNEASQPSETNAFLRWKHSWIGRLVWTMLDVLIVLSFAMLATDSGALWQWGVAVLFAIDVLYQLTQLIKVSIYYGQAAKTR